jgi:hypothetical protein
MALAVVRSIDAPRRLTSPQDAGDYEQELVDQYLLASMGAGCRDSTLANDRSVLLSSPGFWAVRCGRQGRRMQTGTWPNAHELSQENRSMVGSRCDVRLLCV